MNVTAIIGSLRTESIHRQIFNHYCDIAKDQFTLTEGVIEGIPLYDGNNDDNEDVAKLARQISQSDGVIFFAPEYNYSVSAPLKNAIDWLSRQDPQPFATKAATIIGASPSNVATARMQYHLRQIGVFLDMQFLNKPEAMIPGVFSKVANNKITDADTIEFLRRHAESFAKFVQKSS